MLPDLDLEQNQFSSPVRPSKRSINLGKSLHKKTTFTPSKSKPFCQEQGAASSVEPVDLNFSDLLSSAIGRITPEKRKGLFEPARTAPEMFDQETNDCNDICDEEILAVLDYLGIDGKTNYLEDVVDALS